MTVIIWLKSERKKARKHLSKHLTAHRIWHSVSDRALRSQRSKLSTRHNLTKRATTPITPTALRAKSKTLPIPPLDRRERLHARLPKKAKKKWRKRRRTPYSVTVRKKRSRMSVSPNPRVAHLHRLPMQRSQKPLNPKLCVPR